MREIDGSGPAPTNYHDRMEWLARRSGTPPTQSTSMFGTCYNIPTDYNARQAQARDYAQSAKDLRRRGF